MIDQQLEQEQQQEEQQEEQQQQQEEEHNDKQSPSHKHGGHDDHDHDDDHKKPCSYHLKFHTMSCTDLPSMDVMGGSDPYIMFTWDYISIASDHEQKGVMKWTSPRKNIWPKTNFISNTLNPIYDKDMEINLYMNGPIGIEGMLFVTVYDYDIHSTDDLIGTLPLNIQSLVSQIKKSSSSNNNNQNNNQQNNKTQIKLDQPLMKYGKYYGKIQCTIDIERFDTLIDIHDKSKKQIHCWNRLGFCCGL